MSLILTKALLILNAWSKEARMKAAAARKRKGGKNTDDLESHGSSVRDRLAAGGHSKERQKRLIDLHKAISDKKGAKSARELIDKHNADAEKYGTSKMNKAKEKSMEAYGRTKAKAEHSRMTKDLKAKKLRSSSQISKDDARSLAHEIRGESRMG